MGSRDIHIQLMLLMLLFCWITITLSKLSPCKIKETSTIFIFKNDMKLVNENMCTFSLLTVLINLIDNGISNHQ